MIQVNCRTIECKKLCAIIPEGNGIKRNAPSSRNGANASIYLIIKALIFYTTTVLNTQAIDSKHIITIATITQKLPAMVQRLATTIAPALHYPSSEYTSQQATTAAVSVLRRDLPR